MVGGNDRGRKLFGGSKADSVRPYGPFDDRKDLLHRHSAMRVIGKGHFM
jgi:hypothetical protein